LDSSKKRYDIKMLNGLVVKDLSEKQVKEGLANGRFLPSDFIINDNREWIHLKDSAFVRKDRIKYNGWMALFVISFILNILMLLLIFWQKSRIDKLI